MIPNPLLHPRPTRRQTTTATPTTAAAGNLQRRTSIPPALPALPTHAPISYPPTPAPSTPTDPDAEFNARANSLIAKLHSDLGIPSVVGLAAAVAATIGAAGVAVTVPVSGDAVDPVLMGERGVRGSSVRDVRGSSVRAEMGSLSGADGVNEKIVGEEEESGKDEEGKRGTEVVGGVFGDERGREQRFVTMRWWQTALLMIAETISLGILSLPAVLATVGLVPGILLLLALGGLSTYTGHTLHRLIMLHPKLHNMSDVGHLLFSSFGPLPAAIAREVFGAAYLMFLLFIMASHVLTFSIMMNVLTDHAVCTTVFMVVGMAVSVLGTLPRRLGGLGWGCGVSFASILVAVGITMAGVAIWKPDDGTVRAFNETALSSAFLGITNIVFAYAGHVAFFTFISEMVRPQDFTKALYLVQATDTVVYIVAASVIYVYAGSGVTSPALGSTSPLIRKIAWGIAAPTVVVGGVINGHVAAKYIWVRWLRGDERIGQGGWGMWTAWVAVATSLWGISWMVAESVPVFENLLGVVSSLFASWFTFGLPGVFWLWIYYGRWTASRWSIFLCGVNWGLVLVGAVICGFGFWASVVAVQKAEGRGVWSCADNSLLGGVGRGH